MTWKLRQSKLQRCEDVTQRDYIKTSLWRLHDVLATQFLWRIWFLYYLNEMGFVAYWASTYLKSFSCLLLPIFTNSSNKTFFTIFSALYLDQLVDPFFWWKSKWILLKKVNHILLQKYDKNYYNLDKSK